MKIALIIGIITICLLGFLLFVWYISKSQTKKPIDEVKEQEKKQVDFIKERQALYQKDKDVQKVNLLSSENRGALFERAIERKRNQYRDDDEEYAKRLTEQEKNKEEFSEEEPKREEFVPVKHAISSFIKSETIKKEENFSDEVSKISKVESENHEETESKTEEKKSEENTMPEKEENISERVFRNGSFQQDFEERKKKVEKYKKEKQTAVEKFRDEILLEVENLKKRRKFLMIEEFKY